MKISPRYICMIAFILVGCKASFSPAQIEFLHQLADRPVTCTAGADCKKKWNLAIEWVSKHSQKGIKTINDDLIVTNMVSDGGKPSLKYPEFSVVKYASDKNNYVLDFTTYCDQGFACNPTALQLRADFVAFIMGLPEGVVEVRPGVFQKKISQ